MNSTQSPRLRKARSRAPIPEAPPSPPPEPETDAHKQTQAEVQALLTEMQTSFKGFSETIHEKIDGMQLKIEELQHSVDSLSEAAGDPSDEHAPSAPGVATTSANGGTTADAGQREHADAIVPTEP